jgi:ubiquinone/menaquinone biosynthesis C-methylase UbiE
MGADFKFYFEPGQSTWVNTVETTEEQTSTKMAQTSRDYLWLNIRELPYFRSLVRSVEASYYTRFDLPAPTLDLGCGDGHFATVAFDRILEVGLDSEEKSLREAIRRGGYRTLIQSLGGRMPFPDSYFGSAMSNSVLEHIPQVDEVLQEVHRVLKPGAPFVFCVPNQNFLASLSVGRFLDRINLSRLGDIYRSFFNRISRHYHSDPPETWQARLEHAGFSLERCWNYYLPRSMQVTELGHYFGLPCWICYILTGRWILVPTRWNLMFTYRIIMKYFDNAEYQDGVYSFYITRRN